MTSPALIEMEDGGGVPGSLHARKGEVGLKRGSMVVHWRWVSQGLLSCSSGGVEGSYLPSQSVS